MKLTSSVNGPILRISHTLLLVQVGTPLGNVYLSSRGRAIQRIIQMHQLMYQDSQLGVPQPSTTVEKLLPPSTSAEEGTILDAREVREFPEIRADEDGSLQRQCRCLGGRRAEHPKCCRVRVWLTFRTCTFQDWWFLGGVEVLSLGDGTEYLPGDGEVGVGFEVGAKAVRRAGAQFKVGENEMESLPELSEELVNLSRAVGALAPVDDVVSAVRGVSRIGEGYQKVEDIDHDGQLHLVRRPIQCTVVSLRFSS